jgi:hypothetical protein
VVGGRTPNFDVSHDHNHTIDVCTSNPKVAWLSIVIINWGASLERVTSNNLKKQSLTGAVKDPSPESIFTKVQIFESNFKMLRLL